MLGGLIGRNMGLIEKCHASCYVEGDYRIGGLVGSNYGSIQTSYSTGEATGSDRYTGGLVGDNLGNISDCYSQCVVQGGMEVGGLVGRTLEVLMVMVTSKRAIAPVLSQEMRMLAVSLAIIIGATLHHVSGILKPQA